MSLYRARIPAGLLLGSLLLTTPGGASGQPGTTSPDGGSPGPYAVVHDLLSAHELSRGEGVRVGVLDHTFGVDLHRDLYAGGENFQGGPWVVRYHGSSSHGYRMAAVVREIAPEAEIYALGTADHTDEAALVDAMVRAIDWAIEHRLDVLTYSGPAITPELRPRLDLAISRAHAAGIVTTFAHHQHPDNLLPSWSAALDEHFERDPASPVTAGIVALLLSLDRTLTPEECRRIMAEASRPVELGHTGDRETAGELATAGERVPDAYLAVRTVADRLQPQLGWVRSRVSASR